MINETFYAYTAGFIDGDGCFSIGFHKRNPLKKRFESVFIFSNTNADIINKFHKIYGGYISISKNHNKGHKPQIQLRIKGYKEFFNNIDPFLVEKREESKIFKDFHIFKNQRFEKIEEMKKMKNSENLVKKSHVSEFKKLKNTIIPTKEDFAYLAGFIDAECCLSIQKEKRKKGLPTYKTVLSCNNTKAPCFKWLIERFGGTITFIDRERNNPNWRNQLCWRVSSNSLDSILNEIHPYLIIKKAVCEELMSFKKTIVSLKGSPSRNSKKFKEFYLPIVEEKECIFQKVHSLNKKGSNI